MSHRQLLVIAWIGWLAACTSQERSPPPPLPSAPAGTSISAPSTAGKVVIAAAHGAGQVTIEIRGQELDVEAYGQHLSAKSKGDKRYYQRSDGSAFVEVKAGDGGFKLRSPDSKLLWKIKIADDKIKISDNEENERPWLLKQKEAGKTKVLDPGETELGEVKLNAETGKIKLKDAAGNEQFVVTSGASSPAYGVLLMQGIPDSHRAIILAELLARGH